MSKLISVIGEGNGDKSLLGGKGFYLNEMAIEGLPVPPGFTITTEAYKLWNANKRKVVGELRDAIFGGLSRLEEISQRGLGGSDSPLLVSVRSGAPVSMPGMMKTILNVGSNDATVDALARESGDEFAKGTFLQFLSDYSSAVQGKSPNVQRYARKIDIPDLRSSFDLGYKLNQVGYFDRQDLLGKLKTQRRRVLRGDDVKFDFLKDIPKFRLGKEFAFEGILMGIEISGSPIRELTAEDPRNGEILSVNEYGVEIKWEDGQSEGISFDDLEENRVIDFSPIVREKVRSYLEEVGTLGDPMADIMRIKRHIGVPEDPLEQVLNSVGAVFRSWNSNRAREYRKIHDMPNDVGTAVNVQQMVFGNKDEKSGTAVIFSSDPATGESRLSGSYLLGHQGEDIVSSKVTSIPISRLADVSPLIHARLEDIARSLENGKVEVQDMEVTWESDSPEDLYVLQRRKSIMSRSGTLASLIRFYEEGRITDGELIRRVDSEDIKHIASQKALDLSPEDEPIAEGEGNGEGVVSGYIFDAAHSKWKDREEINDFPNIILYVPNADTKDISLIRRASGIITNEGSASAHAGLVATSLGKPIVAGCGNLLRGGHSPGNLTFGDGIARWFGEFAESAITLDSSSGKVYSGIIEVKEGRKNPNIGRITKIAKGIVEGRPISFEIQSLDDLTSIESQHSPGTEVVYNIDADCLFRSGFYDGRNTSGAEKNLKTRGREVYEALIQNGWTDFVLSMDGKFDSALSRGGINPISTAHHFLKGFVDVAGSGLTILRGPEHSYDTENMELWLQGIKGKRGFTARERGDYFKEESRVLIRPWAPDESYLAAAKEVVSNV